MNKTKTALSVVLFLLWSWSGAAAYERWWNYYDTGATCSQKGRWKEAVEAFKMALNQDSIDRNKARTYGMHFTEYYPHRKLGIAYMNIRDWDKAIVELSLSLSQVDDAETRKALEQARRMRVTAFTQDTAPPSLTITSPVDGRLVNTLSLTMEGAVHDDLYVATVTVNGKPASMTPGRETAFTYTAALAPGKNVFEIEARDGLEKSTKKIFTVISDPEPPLITTNLPINGLVVTSPSLELRGVVTDSMFVASVSINKETVAGQGPKVPIQKTLTLKEGENRIIIEAKDSAGNVSSGTITVKLDMGVPEIVITSPEKGKMSATKEITVKGTVKDGRGVSAIFVNDKPVKTSNQKSESFSQTVLLGPKDTSIIVKARNLIGNESVETIPVGVDADGPLVSLADMPDTYTVYNIDTLSFKGSASDKSGVKSVSVNDIKLAISPGEHVMFSYTLPLKEGDNPVEITAGDVLGNLRSVKKVVKRETKDIKKVGARLAVAVVRFDRQGRPLDWNLEERLTEALLGVKRFTLIEKMKIEEVLKEQAFSLTGAVDSASAVRVGKMLGADAIMIGTVNNTGGHVEIDVRLVDAEGGSVITAHSAYGEGEKPESRRRMVEELAQKFRSDFPMVDGIVVQVEKEKIFVDIGAIQGIRKDMKCVIYRDEEPIKHPVTGEVLGRKTRELGSVTLREVYDKMSEAIVLAKGVDIKVGDRIVTK